LSQLTTRQRQIKDQENCIPKQRCRLNSTHQENTARNRRFGSRLCENSEVAPARRTFVLNGLNKKRTSLSVNVESSKERKQFCAFSARRRFTQPGPETDLTAPKCDFRYTPNSGRVRRISGWPVQDEKATYAAYRTQPAGVTGGLKRVNPSKSNSEPFAGEVLIEDYYR
jgi:hypothetical protein